MELDVHLTRDGEEPWGFELTEENGRIISIDKVDPSSPAAIGGLQPGDIVTRIGDKLTSDLSLEDAKRIVAEAVGSLAFGICRGLYDPVLDDYEPIYEVDPGDLDRQSATEVQDPLNDPEQLLRPITPYTPDLPENQEELSFQRSLTSSPYKPYRPFSTEPLEIPPLEEPIILNPEYKDGFPPNLNIDDGFGNLDDVLANTLIGANLIKNGFKLPISKQYDPNYGKKIDKILENVGKEKKYDKIDVKVEEFSNQIETSKLDTEITKITEKSSKSDINVIETEQCNLKTEFNVESIEKTATDIVDESIERAVSVTEEIKREIDEELRASMTREEVKETEQSTKVDIKETKIDKTETLETQVVSQESVGIQDYESLQTNSEIQETAVSEHKYESKEFNSQKESGSVEMNYRETEKEFTEYNMKYDKDVHEEQSRTEKEMRTETKEEYYTEESDTKETAYMIGLQTIPNIRGMVQTSHHFDLLLRTFFIHLTDVMVALSRFILTQPIKELDKKSEKVIKENLVHTGKKIGRKVSTETAKDKQVTRKDIETERKSEKTVAKDIIATEIKKQDKQVIQENQTLTNGYKEEIGIEEYEKRRITGAEMAQRTQRKSKELTQKMEAVITEFENKAGLEDEIEKRRSRSRSRSRLGEECQELESIFEKSTKEMSEINKSTYESKETRITDTTRDLLTPSKQMYVAIVESHVYTNKDAIVEASLRNEEIKAIDTQAETVENLTLTSAKVEAAKTSVATAEFTKVTAKSEATVQTEEIKQDIVRELKESKVDRREATVKQEMLTNIASESTELTSVSDVKVFESKEVKDSQAVIKSEENYKEAALETVEIALEATEEVTSESITKKEASATKEQHLTKIASESTEVFIDSKVESFDSYEAKAKSVKLDTEESFKMAAVHTTNTLIEEAKEVTSEFKLNTKQATSKIEQLSIATAESTDIVADDSEIKSLSIAKTDTQTAKLKSEETYKTAAIETSDVAFESVEEDHVFIQKEKANIREDNRHLSVAGIIETKTELCKEPPKTYDEDGAELKITKHEFIDVENTVKITESELNIQNSLEITNIHENHETIFSQSQQVSNKSETYEIIKDKSLKLDTNLTDVREEIDTPTPSTVPPTPLTDEYVFKLEIPLPKSRGSTPFIEEVEEEDPHIVKKKLVPYIESHIEDQIIYDPPLPTPVEEKKEPVYVKPGLRGGCVLYYPEYIREIERKSSLLASAIDETIKSIEEYKEEVGIQQEGTECNPSEEVFEAIVKYTLSKGLKEVKLEEEEAVEEELEEEIELPGFRTVQFCPLGGKADKKVEVTQEIEEGRQSKLYVDDKGEPIGTAQGIIDGLQEATVDENTAKELGKPGLADEKVAEIISGESDMMREAHVMGLTRVITSHMHRPDDLEEVPKIKPLVESLKNSEVIKALNEEIKLEEKKKEEKKWTTFLQKPSRPVPRAKFGVCAVEDVEQEPYKVKIVKQPKPKVAPDYKPEDFDTGPLPWEERASKEPPPSPVELEDPILIPEDTPEFLEAVDPLPESEVPDLEDTGIPLPSQLKIVTVEIIDEKQPDAEEEHFEEEAAEEEAVEEEAVEEEVVEEDSEDMDMSVEKKAEKLVEGVKSMVDPKAPIDQQLAQMRAQLAALAQLPFVIQQSLEALTKHLTVMGQQQECEESMQCQEMQVSYDSQVEEYQERTEQSYENHEQNEVSETENHCVIEEMLTPIEESKEEVQQPTQEEIEEERRRQEMMEEQQINEKQKKGIEDQAKLEQESRQIKQRPTPRVGKPKRMFGPLNPEVRPLVLPGGRRWKSPNDPFNEQLFAETVQAQSELIQGKAMGYFESEFVPYEKRINFKKYEKPPVSLDHLQNSEVYKIVHNMDQTPLKQVEMRAPAMAEADYRERCRSNTPSCPMVSGRPQQFQP